jgi:hypothetical protein
MITIKAIIQTSFILMSSLAIVACNNDTTAKVESESATDTSATSKPVPPAEFTPFIVVEVSHSVKDYAAWRPAFNTDSAERKASGLKDMVVGRQIDNPNNLIAVMEVADIQKAKDFAASPRLKEVMGKAGVISKPVIEFWNVIRMAPEANEKQWILVTHKVKDFNAWLKVFDAEGSASRASQGLIDVALAQGIDDPNLVHIVFDTKDMAKAKASILSEEKKKLMQSAGVEGPPKIDYYNFAE